MSDKCSNGKHSKSRISGLVAKNAVGDKLPMFVLINGKITGVLSMLNHRNVDIDHSKKFG